MPIRAPALLFLYELDEQVSHAALGRLREFDIYKHNRKYVVVCDMLLPVHKTLFLTYYAQYI